MLALLVGFPTVVFTVLLGVALVYWGFVVLGALDLDLLGGGHDGAADGLADGVADGAGHVHADGVADGAGHVHADGHGHDVDVDGDGDADADGDGHFSLLGSLGLNRAPLTVTFSVFIAIGWLLTAVISQSLAPLVPLPAWATGTATLLASSAASLFVTSFLTRPLGRLFVPHKAQTMSALVGRVAVVSTGKVDGSFGQATTEDGGAGFILQVRCDDPKALKRGDKALLVAWDDEKGVFVVEPLDPMLQESGRPRRGAVRVTAQSIRDTGAAEAADESPRAGRAVRRS